VVIGNEAPRLVDERLCDLAAVIGDGVLCGKDLGREPIVALEMPNGFDWAALRAIGGQDAGNAAVAAGRMIRMGARVVTHARCKQKPLCRRFCGAQRDSGGSPRRQCHAAQR
jgi:hypothetical protein